ncbi:MAG: hypothetical protein ABI053_09615, partial [Lacisediminihabitans sp.]
ESYVLEGAAGLPHWDATADRLRAEHRSIVMAIIAGDRTAATLHTHNHISGYYAETHLTTTRHNESHDHG